MSADEDASENKLRGGYYTPPELANLLTDWALPTGKERVLEPSCGDGNFIEAAASRLTEGGSITGVELFESEAKKAQLRGGAQATVIVAEAFEWYRQQAAPGTFDAVLGNPPFVRYQNFPEEHRQVAFELMRNQGLNPSRLTNSWLPFVVLATDALRNGGRLGVVLPAEVLQVGYAAELREYLARNYSELTIVTFRRLVFKGILQETVLLMGIRQANAVATIVFRELHDLDGLASLNGHHDAFTVDLDHAREKWTQYYLSAAELGLIRELERAPTFTTLGALADIDVGIVTGRNEFFVLTPKEATELGVMEWCVPLVGKSAQIPGLRLSGEAWGELVTADSKCLLLNLPDVARAELSAQAVAYVEDGEHRNFHSGYKCRIRQPRWWTIPSLWIPEAFFLRQIYDAPRVILNDAGATCTDTIHRVRIKGATDPSALATSSVNSLTCAFAEIRGRSYGGGVLELEPTEAESLPIPNPQQLDNADLESRLRARGPAAVMEEVDRVLLRGAGVGGQEIVMLRGVWQKLSSRRQQRTRRGPMRGDGRAASPAHTEMVRPTGDEKVSGPTPGLVRAPAGSSN